MTKRLPSWAAMPWLERPVGSAGPAVQPLMLPLLIAVEKVWTVAAVVVPPVM